MKAKDANWLTVTLLTKKTQPQYDMVMVEVDKAARSGLFQLQFPPNLDLFVIDRLTNDGYEVSFDEEMIYWKHIR